MGSPFGYPPNVYQVRLSMLGSQADVDPDDQIWAGDFASPASVRVHGRLSFGKISGMVVLDGKFDAGARDPERRTAA